MFIAVIRRDYFDLAPIDRADEGTRMGGSLLTRARRFAPLLVSVLWLALAGCSSIGLSAASAADRDTTREMFVTGLSDIGAVYIDPVDLGDVTVAGLKRLDEIDPSVTLVRSGSEIELELGGEEVAVFEAPAPGAAADWGVLSTSYVEAAQRASPKLAEAPNEKIYEVVFDGMVSKLDGFSRYASAADAAENRASREGFGGIGVRVAVADGKVRIVSVMNYTPAQRAGLQPDDIIAAIDGRSVAGLDQRDVIDELRGPVDSRVTLTIQRGETGAPLTVTLARARVVPETVIYQPEGNVAYFHLYGFNSDTAESLAREISHAKAEIGTDFSGIVLDLRSDPGGLLDEAVAVTDLFIQEGRIVSTYGRHPDSHQYFEATAGDVIDGRPIVVLVNGNSASASEIVAAALQDSGRAVVVGSNSYGKGTVQTVLRLPNSGELTLTWARFRAPSGYTLNKLGVLPSICTSGRDARELIADLRDGRLRPIPVTQRNALTPTDSAAMNRLRESCPQVKSEPSGDLEVALALIRQPLLYAKALALGGPTSPAVSTEAAAVAGTQP